MSASGAGLASGKPSRALTSRPRRPMAGRAGGFPLRRPPGWLFKWIPRERSVGAAGRAGPRGRAGGLRRAPGAPGPPLTLPSHLRTWDLVFPGVWCGSVLAGRLAAEEPGLARPLT